MKQLITLILIATVSSGAFAQEDANLVPNGSFENAETKRLKSFGMLEEFGEDWYNATKSPADLFSKGIKSEKVLIPENEYGKQDAADGDLYAGFRAYSKDSKLNRSYLAVELTEGMEKNQMYCMEFKLSLADLSKFATTHIGAVFMDRKTIQPNTGAIVRDLNDIHIKHRANKPIMLQDGWETVCGTYTAKGDEEYLVIGCFGGDQDLQLEKMKRPRGIVGGQNYDAYYYIDDVKIFPVEARSQCSCDPAAHTEPDLIYGSTKVMNDNMSDEEIVSVSAVYYAFLKKRPTAAGEKTLDKLAGIMKANPSWKLEVIGHCGTDEFNESKINPRYNDMGKQRAEQAVRYLEEKGVDPSRLITLTKENTDPANSRPTPLSRAQNRRVVFEIRK